MNDSIASINNPKHLETLQCSARLILEPSIISIKRDWIVDHVWVAVPVESASHFDEMDAERLASAMADCNLTLCYAVAAEPLKNFPLGFAIEASKVGLLDFSRKCGHFNFLIVPSNSTFAVLCTVFDYFVIAGPITFVESALRSTIAEARARFREYSTDTDHPERMIAIARYYEECSQ